MNDPFSDVSLDSKVLSHNPCTIPLSHWPDAFAMEVDGMLVRWRGLRLIQQSYPSIPIRRKKKKVRRHPDASRIPHHQSTAFQIF